MEGRFLGRDIIDKPTCPFCSALIEQPKELATRMPHEMPVGRCDCGAVYAFDVTGHNLGSAMIDALVFGCNGDWDLAWGLLPEEDYLEKMVENYDIESDLIVYGGVYEGRRIAGVLYFIRLHEDVREVTEEGTQRQLHRATPVQMGTSFKPRKRKSFSKKDVEKLVKDYRIEPLLQMAEQDKRIIRDLRRLLYSVDRLVRCRASDILGKASAVISQKDPGTISKFLQGLLTSLSDSAASSWGSLDAIGDIIANSPKQFAGYLPQIYRFTNDRELLPEVLRTLGKIAGVEPDLIRNKSYLFIPLLQDVEPEIRGYSIILLGNLNAHEAKDDLKKLVKDSSKIEIYRDGDLEERTIGRLATEALERIKEHKDSRGQGDKDSSEMIKK
ncbi:MAG: PBS lyase [Deltaproteobacteria bacterium]|nr:PBS lyase [Deltaproteobacteria bacterium]